MTHMTPEVMMAEAAIYREAADYLRLGAKRPTLTTYDSDRMRMLADKLTQYAVSRESLADTVTKRASPGLFPPAPTVTKGASPGLFPPAPKVDPCANGHKTCGGCSRCLTCEYCKCYQRR